MRRRLAAALLLAAAARAAGAQPAAPALLLVSVDGLKPEYVRAADSLGLRVPALRRLAAEGARADGVVGVVPTVTYPSHATLVTGVAPARHGVSSNTTFDPLLRNQHGWYWYAEDVRARTLWEAAAAAGRTTAAVHWPVTVGARGVTWLVPQVWRTGSADDRKLVRALATPGLLDSLERRVGAPYADGIDEGPEADLRRARFTAALLAWKRPGATFAYLTAFDHAQHEHGPYAPEALAVLERVDAALDTIVRAARTAHGGRVTVAVVSDHGFARTHTEVHLGALFAEAGLVTVGADGRPTAWTAMPWPAGGSAAVVLRDSADTAGARRTGEVLARLAADTAYGIRRVLGRAALDSAGGFPEAQWLVAFRPGYRVGYALRGAGRGPVTGGTHGYLPSEPEMRATFLVAGPGVAAGRSLGTMDMRDVAPTLAARLGVRLPGAEGRDVLAARQAAGGR